jgi:hypothetical protein
MGQLVDWRLVDRSIGLGLYVFFIGPLEFFVGLLWAAGIVEEVATAIGAW